MEREDPAAAPRGRPRDPSIDPTVLAAVRRELTDKGYQRMSVAEVARSAGVTKPTIYRRWPTKKDLVIAAIESSPEPEPPPLCGDTRRDLITIMHNFRTTPPPNLGILFAVTAERKNLPELLEIFGERAESRRGWIRSILERARDRGEIRTDIDLAPVASMMMASVFAGYVGWEEMGPEWENDLVSTVLDGLLPRLRG